MADVVRDAIAAEITQLARIVRVPEGDLGYGVDLVCRDDLTPRLDELDPNGVAGIGQALYHRLTTRRTTLPDDPDYGLNVLRYLSLPTDTLSLRRYAGEIASECRKDDRVASADVTITMPTPKLMRITITVEPQDPELEAFSLIIAVTDGTALLEAINGQQ